MELSDKTPQGYKESESKSPFGIQQFDAFGQADYLFREYCARCHKEKKCDLNRGLRQAIGENCPIWFPAFVKLSKISHDLDDTRPDYIVICTDYEDPQMKLPFPE